jgi:hypothetical protein
MNGECRMMNKDDKNPQDKIPGDVLANMDQMEAFLESLAMPIGTYYKNLVENGVPKTLAAKLVLDFHTNLLTKFGPGKSGEG